MFGTRAVRFSRGGGAAHAGARVIAVLLCLFSLTVEATRAHCLALDGECAAPATAPADRCHDQTPADGSESSCDSCIDIVVPEEASVSCSRPDRDLPAPAAAPLATAAGADLHAGNDALSPAGGPVTGALPLHLALRTTVLRI